MARVWLQAPGKATGQGPPNLSPNPLMERGDSDAHVTTIALLVQQLALQM